MQHQAFIRRGGKSIPVAYDVEKRHWVEIPQEIATEEAVPAPPKPMLAEVYKGEEISFPVLAQPKLDGVRCLAREDGLWLRGGGKVESCPHIRAALQDVFSRFPGVVVDGELFAEGMTLGRIAGAARASAPTRDSRSLKLVAFDLNAAGTAAERQEVLAVIASMGVDVVETVECRDHADLDSHYQACLESGHEGQMIRDAGAHYSPKRCRSILKRKPHEDREARLARFAIGDAGKVTAILRDDRFGEFPATIAASAKECEKMARFSKAYIGADVTFRFSGVLPSGLPRFPVATTFYPGGRDT